jgi:arginine-tRNA-protein transferase
VGLEKDIDEARLSLFDLNMPGNLSLEEVEALDLGNWHLLYHGAFVQMSVSFTPC